MSATDRIIDAACRWAIDAYREGDSVEFVADVLEVVTEKAVAA